MTDADQAEFDALWEAYHPRVHAYALRRTDPASAQDIASEVFLVAWRRRADRPAEALPWLLAVARRLLANHFRSQRRRQALAEVLIDLASAPHGEGEVDTELLTAIAALSDEHREALLLVGWDGLRPYEAAQVLGCSPTAFRVRLLRARRALRPLLDDGVASPEIPAEEASA